MIPVFHISRIKLIKSVFRYICIVSDITGNIELFKSVFRGRTDLYAIRWEKEGRSGYMPAYKVDWSDYNKHKAQGGIFKNYKIVFSN